MLGMLLMHLAGARSGRPMVYASRIMEVATLISFLQLFVQKMPSWGLQDTPAMRLQLVMMVCIGVAVLLPICHYLQWARFARFIPLPVFAGFGNAISITILLSQGQLLWQLVEQQAWFIGALIGLTASSALLIQHFWQRAPAAMWGLLLGSALAALAPFWHQEPLAMLGQASASWTVPLSLVRWHDVLQPGVDVLAVFQHVLIASVILSLVTFLNTVIAEAAMTQTDGQRASKGDWKPLAWGQFGSILLGCTPLTPSISASRAAAATGALTSQALLLLGLLSVSIYAIGVLSWVPVAAISGVLLLDAWNNAHRPSLQLSWQYLRSRRQLYSVQKEDLMLIWMVVAAAVFYNMIVGVLVGVMGGLVLYALRNGRSVVRTIRTGEAMHSNCVWSAAESALLAQSGKHTRYIALDGALFFGVADSLQQQLQKEVACCKRLILDWSQVHSLDSAVAVAVGNVLRYAQNQAASMVFCGLDTAGHDVRTTLALNLTLPLQFPDADRALEWAELDILQTVQSRPESMDVLRLEGVGTLIGMSQPESLEFQKYLRYGHFEHGAVVFQRGDRGAEMMFILQGAADVKIAGLHGRDVRVALYRQGAMVGEMGFLDGQPRSATVTAVTPLAVAVLHRRDFDAFAVQHPSAARQLLMHVAIELNARLRRTNRIL
jgi:MFS superfamily sulfate permease-like transporter/CRP-like cAMP-binding protein